MRNRRSPWALALGPVVREGIALTLSAGLALALSFLVSRDLGSQGEESRGLSKDPAWPLCGQWHRGGGETSPVDLARVRQAYQELRAQVGRSLVRPALELFPALHLGAGGELPACRGTAQRRVALPAERAELLRGRSFIFARVGSSGELSLPADVEQDSQALVLFLPQGKGFDLSGIQKRLGRPLGLADVEFAKALGVSCLPCRVRISEGDNELELREGP